MRKTTASARKTLTFALVLGAMLTFSTRCYALFGLFGFGIPVIEPVSTASQLGKTVSVAATEVISLLNKAQQVYGNQITAKYLSYVTKFGKNWMRTNNFPAPNGFRSQKLWKRNSALKI